MIGGRLRPRSSWRWTAAVLLAPVLILTACGGGSSSSSSSAASTGSTGSGGHVVTVNKSVVQPGPGGSKVKVTLVSYQDKIAESTHETLAPNAFGITLRFQNLGNRTINANRPTYYAVLRMENTAGADEIPHATGPCGGTFYNSRIHLAPHASVEGCIPYAYGESKPVTFGFGLGSGITNWPVGS